MRGRQHRNYSEILIQMKTENDERIQSFSTGFYFNDIEISFSDPSALNCKTTITHTGQSNAIYMSHMRMKNDSRTFKRMLKRRRTV